ncbi:hypothetical protein HDF16_005333 [Granulicella aggregans]|uniref:Uncharacterized protein n=1 Tax=Granulicella aggregans TaxID=474949 RepID=A0A7W7ZIT2_9BACT|nr:hypothetical protein [Granulicella aggregans]MBB5060597.1 hypothetical protein [Granulicella aggregans]
MKIVPFVLTEKKYAEIAIEAFNRTMDDLVIRRIPILNSGVESVQIDHVENAEEILKEFDETPEDD